MGGNCELRLVNLVIGNKQLAYFMLSDKSRLCTHVAFQLSNFHSVHRQIYKPPLNNSIGRVPSCFYHGKVFYFI